jgi:hypothetical protein
MLIELVDFKSNFNTLKVIKIWLVILVVLISPWLFLLSHFDKALAAWALFITITVLIIIIYINLSLKIVIDQQELVVEYYWVKLWGSKHQRTIPIKNARISLSIINFRGNELWNLTITDNEDLRKKIKLTETTDGFDEQQIKQMYKTLKQINADQDNS